MFDAILRNAAGICQAQFGTLNLYDGTAYRTVALHNAPQHFARKRLGETFRPHPDSGLAYVARKKQVVQIDDIRTRQPYIEGNKTVVELADIAGARTLLIVPMLNKEKLVETISIYRQEVRPFTDKQIELVQEFRRPSGHRYRERSVAQRTAPVLRATDSYLRRSAGYLKLPRDLDPVFTTMLEKTVHICDAKYGTGDRTHCGVCPRRRQRLGGYEQGVQVWSPSLVCTNPNSLQSRNVNSRVASTPRDVHQRNEPRRGGNRSPFPLFPQGGDKVPPHG